MRLQDLLLQVPHLTVRGEVNRSIGHLTVDSRDASPGSLFVALRGRRADGHRFVPQLDVAAVFVEEEVAARPGVTVVRVDDAALALARAAAALAGHPSRALDVVGVTGTNGKTTTCAMIEAMGQAAGWRVGVVGTTGHRVGGETLGEAYTTPPAPQWQALLGRMRDEGCALVAAEVSSIGLASRRVDATRFPVAAWTNLSQDHLDVHGDMQTYQRAKRRLFTELLDADGLAVLNAGDPGVWPLPGLPDSARVWRFGAPGAELAAEALAMDIHGSRFELCTPAGRAPVRLNLPGAHNVQNALAAAGCALGVGLTLDHVAAGLERMQRVPGRLEPVDRGQPFGVLVDYAHTDDALRIVLAALRPLTPGRLIVVFGCAGDRDRLKRPLMAGAASEGADLVVATSDNPRSEDPLAILEDVRGGLRPDALVEPDRREAIRLALGLARPGDVVLIAGKGHETTQEVSGVRTPFDDRLVAAKILEDHA